MSIFVLRWGYPFEITVVQVEEQTSRFSRCVSNLGVPHCNYGQILALFPLENKGRFPIQLGISTSIPLLAIEEGKTGAKTL